VNPDNKQALMSNILYNNSSHIEISEDAKYTPFGNKTEVALIKWVQDADYPVAEKMNTRIKNEVFRMPFGH
jgi:magnesium-transporting ATPase (P-type)